MIKSRESLQQHLASIVESSDDAIITKDLDSIIQSWNRAAERLFQYSAEEAIGQPITIIFPEDRLDEESDLIARIRRGERIAHFETVRRRKDGSLVPISLSVSPIRDVDGRVVGASKIARDITLQRQAEQQQRMLLSEMRHRVGNCFAVAGGLVGICARQASGAEELAQMLQGRFASLSRAHSLAVRRPDQEDAPGEAMTLSELVGAIVAPYVGVARLNMQVEALPVASEAITPLALVLYELSTNAVKYGGLSQPDCGLDIRSELEGDRVRIRWTETCRIEDLEAARTREGFGTQMSQSTVASYFDGSIERTFRRSGMSAVLDLSAEKVMDPLPDMALRSA